MKQRNDTQRKVVSRRRNCARDRLQFLPAAIQIESSPAPVYGRLIIWAIVALTAIAILWACIGTIDIVAVAPGKVIPSGKVRQIQSFERAKVQKIHVHDGQRVAQGDPLVSFDSTFSAADQQQAMDGLHDAAARWLVEYAYNLFLQDLSKAEIEASELIATALKQLEASSGPYPLHVDTPFLSRVLSNRIKLHQARRAALRQEIEALAGSMHSAGAIASGLRITLPIIQERAESLKGLFQRQLASRDQYLQQEQKRIETRQRLASEESRVAALQAQIGQVRSRLDSLAREALEQNLNAMNDARLQRAMLRQRLNKAAEQRQRSVLHAPVDGIVTQLRIHTIGGIVSPAQLLMNLTPINERLEVEAFIRNRDIGFVSAGQDSAIKIDAYNFTRYGSIDGTLKTLSSDAVDQKGMGLVYPAIFSLASNSIEVENKLLALSAGMSVSVEIKTGSRRIIDFFLSPLMKKGSESIRER